MPMLCDLTDLSEIETTAEIKNFAVSLKAENGSNHQNISPCESLQNYFSTAENRERFKNVHKLYQYVFTMPSTQVDCERSFSVMGKIKSSIRSSMSDELLDCCIILQLSRDFLPKSSHGVIIDELASKHKRLTKHLSYHK